MNDSSPEMIAIAEEYLKKMKPNIAGWEADFGKEMMTKGKAWLNFTWSGDAVWAMEEASAVGVDLGYEVPLEGSNIWYDGWAIPKYARNVKAASYFIPKKYKNLVGYTFGTGLGVGLVIDNRLNRGDNSCVETFCLRHKKMPEIIVEDGASIRAVKRVYGEASGDVNHTFEPKDICEIAEGKRPGDVEAAKKAFAEMGEIAGDAMATAVTLVDGLIVIGGGITAARKWIMPSLLNELRSKMHQLNGNELNRVQMKVYDLDDETEFREFAKGAQRPLKVYGTDRYVAYDPQKRIGVTISKLGASQAISVGAYAFALSQLDTENA